MTEDDAKSYVASRITADVDGRMARLEHFITLLTAEMASQNLIARSTLDSVWSRHVADSIQLLDHIPADAPAGNWLDIGTGAGFPGLVIAIATDWRVTMIEPRARRVDYLNRMTSALEIDHAEIICASVEKVEPINSADIISARAVASIAPSAATKL